VSVSPASGSGLSQTFTFTFSDTGGYQSLAGGNALISSSTNGSAACWLYYDMSGPALWLASDDASTWSSAPVGSSNTLQNSQCSINAGGVSATGSGNTLSVQVPISFSSAFAGARTIYLRAIDTSGTNSGFSPVGSWTVASPAPVSAPPTPSASLGGVSASPSTGSGAGQTFTFVFADPSGYQSLAGVNGLINSSTAGNAACWFYYDMSGPTLGLASDDTATWSSASVGSSTTLQNSQCAINAAGVSGSGSGTNLTIQVPIVFSASFSGAQTIYLRAIDANNGPSSFSPVGSWTVAMPAAATPAAPATLGAIVGPNGGSGMSPSFTLVLADPNGFANLAGGNLLIATTLNGAGACWVYYDAASNNIWLAHDDTVSWDSAAAGAAVTLANSQCSISAQGVSASGSGALLSVNIPITFSGSFTGAKTLYGRAIDSNSGPSNFAQIGTWIVQ
jgi:hypothetical protein